MGNSDNRSIDRLDALRLVLELQNQKEEVSSVQLLKVKPAIISWLEDKGFIVWNKPHTAVSVTDKGIEELTNRKWI
jgi:hypothetical protein